MVLWRGLVDLSRDIPNSDVDLLASRNRLLVRKDLHPALQYLLLEAMREVHWPAGPFNRLGEFPAEQPNDLPLSPTAEAFYRSGPTFWQRYTSFWLTSLLNRIVFFVIPVVVVMIPVIGLAISLFRWLHIRRSERSTPRKVIRCPLWVISRHVQRTGACPLLPPKADMCGAIANVCFVPIADIVPAVLFDHLAGAHQLRRWHSEPPPFGNILVTVRLPAYILQQPAHRVEFCAEARPVSGLQSLDC